LRRSIQWVIGLLVSAAALWLAFRDVSLSAVSEALATANYGYAPFALGLICLGQACRANGWRTILGPAFSVGRVFRALNAGYLLNNVLPLRLGELGRAYLVSRAHNVSTAQALSSVLVERVIDLCMLVGMLAAFAPLAIGLTGTPAAVAAAFLLPVAALSFLFVVSRRPTWLLNLLQRLVGSLSRVWRNAANIETLLHSFIDGMAALHDARRFWTAVAWSGAAWASAGLSTWLLLRAFVPEATVGMGFFVLVVIGLGIAVPSAPGAIGVWQAAAVAALSAFQVEKTLAVSFGLVNHLANFALLSVLGAVALAREGETLADLARVARALMPSTSSKGPTS
jgi:hypothetical protein